MVALATTFPYASIWSLSGKPSLLLLQDWYLKSTYDTGRRESHYVNVVHPQLPHRHSLRDILLAYPIGGLFPALLHGHRALRPSVVESEQKETADWDICRIYSILTFNTITFQELLQAQLPDASTKALLWG